MKYTISITKEEYDLIITAVNAYVAGLQAKMADQASTWMIKEKRQQLVNVTEDAPYGLKKDGTPKKRPGRKAQK